MGVGVSVVVGVSVIVAVDVGVFSAGAAAPCIWSGVCIRVNTNPASRAIKTIPRAIATGSFRRISGVPLEAARVEAFFVDAVALSCAPQTKQRVAFSLTRVPHTGQIFVFLVSLSCFIIIFPEK